VCSISLYRAIISVSLSISHLHISFLPHLLPSLQLSLSVLFLFVNLFHSICNKELVTGDDYMAGIAAAIAYAVAGEWLFLLTTRYL
jgi:hypothetical protein